jgi:hypothetical protein
LIVPGVGCLETGMGVHSTAGMIGTRSLVCCTPKASFVEMIGADTGVTWLTQPINPATIEIMIISVWQVRM